MKWEVILIIVVLIIVGGLFAYEYWWQPKEETKSLELPKITEEEIADWKIFQESGLYLRLPPDYSQYVFRKLEGEFELVADYRNINEERILLMYGTMGKEANEIAQRNYRNLIRKEESSKGKTRKEIIEGDSLLKVQLGGFPENSEFISAREIKKENCSTFFVTFETDEGKRQKQLEIFPLYNQDYNWFITFFYKEENETKVLKIIQTVECKPPQ